MLSLMYKDVNLDRLKIKTNYIMKYVKRSKVIYIYMCVCVCVCVDAIRKSLNIRNKCRC